MLAAVLVTGCAAGVNDVAPGTGPAGFGLGLWHGLITPVTFLISLFDERVSIYEVRNNGNWYDVGFVLGIAVAFGGGRRSGRVARTRKE